METTKSGEGREENGIRVWFGMMFSSITNPHHPLAIS
jgi:hypothetical protein